MSTDLSTLRADHPRRARRGAVGDRLRRIEGQVGGIRRMYDEGRYCMDVLDQISAARAGLEAAALLVLEDHVKGCVREAIVGGEADAKAAELLEAVRRYVRSV